ncbi:MAG: type II secretion system protein [Thermodesulfobacteriota bacterium]|nr:type II secretion system protein [Thermodesulfobacteriota bacterium]
MSIEKQSEVFIDRIKWTDGNETLGFSLLEVMVAVAIIAIALSAVFGSQSQSVSLANEVKFNTTAPLLAQTWIAEMELEKAEDLASDSGDFGEDYPYYTWESTVRDVHFDSPENVSDHLRQIDLEVSFNKAKALEYRVRLFRFVAKK